MNFNKGISTLVGTIIIVAVVIILVGGVFTYQYFIVKNSEWIKTPITENQTDQIAGWKTYTNDEYGFEIKYPESSVLNDRSEKGFLNIKIDSGSNSRYIEVGLQDTLPIRTLFATEPEPGLTIFNSTENIGDITWSKRESVSIPQNGIGTYGDSLMYWTGKDNLTYIISCNNCVPPPNGGTEADLGFKDFISTFKFITINEDLTSKQASPRQITEKDILGSWSPSLEGEESMLFYIGDDGSHQYGSYSHNSPFYIGKWTLSNGKLIMDYGVAHEPITFISAVRQGNILTLKSADGGISTYTFIGQ